MEMTLGLDVGTQGCKALLLDTATGMVVGRGHATYDLLPATAPGRAEQHPQTWIDGVVTATQQALQAVQDRTAVKAVGVSGQQHGLVVLDAQKQVLRPAKLWCDTESAPEAEELSRALGYTIVPSFTITKLLWLRNHEPDVWTKVRHVLLPHDFVNWWLCGRMVMEAGDASGTGLLDVRTRQWDAKALELVDPCMKDWLPTLIGHSEVVGKLTPAAGTALGLTDQVLVSPGSGDNAMAALGVGLAAPGPMVLSLGTSGTLFGKADQPVLDPTGLVCPFCDATGGGLPLLCTLNCTQPLQQVAAAFNLSHDELTRMAQQEPPACHGVTMLPYLVGERTPNWPHATGALVGLRPGLLRPGLLYRAAIEGATLSLLAGLRRMQSLGMPHPTELRLVGGGARNTLWQQIVADAFQLPVRMPVEVESAALGAAMQAASCLHGQQVANYIAAHPPAMQEVVVQPDQSTADAYEGAFQRFQQLGGALFGG